MTSPPTVEPIVVGLVASQPDGWPGHRAGDHAGGVTTRLGFAMIATGVALLLLRTFGWVDPELLDIASVLGIVVGALVIAIDGDGADQPAE